MVEAELCAEAEEVLLHPQVFSLILRPLQAPGASPCHPAWGGLKDAPCPGECASRGLTPVAAAVGPAGEGEAGRAPDTASSARGGRKGLPGHTAHGQPAGVWGGWLGWAPKPLAGQGAGVWAGWALGSTVPEGTLQGSQLLCIHCWDTGQGLCWWCEPCAGVGCPLCPQPPWGAAEGGRLVGEVSLSLSLCHVAKGRARCARTSARDTSRWAGCGQMCGCGSGQSRADLVSPGASEVEKVSLIGSFRDSGSGLLAGGKALISCCSVGLLLDLLSKMLLDWKNVTIAHLLRKPLR